MNGPVFRPSCARASFSLGPPLNFSFVLDEYRVDIPETLDRAIDVIDDGLLWCAGITQNPGREFDDLQRGVHEIANIEECAGELFDREVLSLNPGDFLFELGSAESINQCQDTGQTKGKNRPRLG